MTSRDFCFWLQGYFELAGETGLDSVQVSTIRRNLALALKGDDPTSAAETPQRELADTSDETLAARLGASIKEGRERKGWNQTKLAEVMSVSRQAVSMWEAGTNLPGVRRWNHLAKVLDLPAIQPRSTT